MIKFITQALGKVVYNMDMVDKSKLMNSSTKEILKKEFMKVTEL
jgi:hypothetical protein